jgi:hypothetical protein
MENVMKTYLKTISLSIAAAALLMAGSARADDDAGNAAWEAGESENPHAVENRDRKVEVAVDTKTTNAEAVVAESENPHSTLNQSQPAQASSDESVRVSVRAAEAGNPHSTDANQK